MIDNQVHFKAVLHIAEDILQKTLDEYRGPVGRGTGPNLTKEFTTAMLVNTGYQVRRNQQEDSRDEQEIESMC